MAQTIKLKRSNTANAEPTTAQLASGELAMNTRDGKVYMRQYIDGTDENDTIIQISGSGSITTGTADPTEDLEEGNLFYDTDDAVFKIYSSSAWKSIGFSDSEGIEFYEYDGSDGATYSSEANRSFSGNDNNSNSLKYLAGFIEVYLNGVKLQNTVDYVATDGATLILEESADDADIIQITRYSKFLGDGSNTLDTFTSNGSTDEFTLSVAPASEANTAVYIDGVYQNKNAYSLNGATLIFGNGNEPPSGSVIEVTISSSQISAETPLSELNVTGNAVLGTAGGATATGTAIKDEDNMASNSASHLATQQSIKAYVDAQVATEDTLAELNDTNITTPADASLLLYDTGTSTWRDAAMSGDVTITDTGVTTVANAATVTGAAQSAITSLGTLTGLSITGAVTVGVNDTGHDVKFFGATSGDYMLWDESRNGLDIYSDATDPLHLMSSASTCGILLKNGGTDANNWLNTNAGSIQLNADANGNSGYVQLLTNNVEGLRIDSSQNVRILNGTVTVGADDTGHDVKFFGATTGKYMLWDESADELEISGNLDLNGNAYFGDNNIAYFGTDNDLRIYHSGSESYIQHSGTGRFFLKSVGSVNIQTNTGEDSIICDANAGQRFYYDAAHVFGTMGNGAKIYGAAPTLTFQDDTSGDDDWKFYADGDGFFLQQYASDTTWTDRIKFNTNGTLDIKSGDNMSFYSGGNRNLLLTPADAQLNYTGDVKLATTSTGVQVTGNISNASGNLTLDVAGYLDIDVDDGGSVYFSDGGVTFGRIYGTGTHLIIKSQIGDKSIKFEGVDGSSPITALTLDMSDAGAATFGGDVTVTGDFTVNGTATTVNTANIIVEDPLMLLSSGASGSPSVDSGFITERGSSTNVGLIWDESHDVFSFINTTDTATTVGNVTIASYANIHANGATFDNNVNISSASYGYQIAGASVLGYAGGNTVVGDLGAGVALEFGGSTKLTTVTGGVLVTGNISNSAGNLTLDVVGDIILDADGGDITLSDAGVGFGNLKNNSSDFLIQSLIEDKDIIFRGNDGNIDVDALTLDMSDGGAAHFINDIRIKDNQAVRFGNDQDFRIYNDNSHTTLHNSVSNQDILFKGNDDGSPITALTLDMSEAGKATFNSSIVVNGNVSNSSGSMNLESVGTFTLDSGGDIILDAAGSDIYFKKAGVTFLQFYPEGSNHVIINSPVSDKDIIFTINKGGSAGTEAMRIDASTNRIGIGWTSPNAPLDIKYTDNANAQRWSYGSSQGGFYLELDTAIAAAGVVSYNFNLMNNSTAYNNNLVLDRGNVGIGTALPAEALHVSGGNLSAIRNNMVRIYSNTDTAGGETNIAHNGYYSSGWKYGVTDEACRINFVDGKIKFDTAAAGSAGAAITWLNGITLLSDGKVGIGTTNPQSILDIEGNYITIGDGTYEGAIGRGNALLNNQTASDFVIGANAGSALALGTNSEDRLHITTAGKVGIGTSSPGGSESSNLLTVAGRVGVKEGSTELEIGTGSGYAWVEAWDGTADRSPKHNICLNPWGGNVGIGTTVPEDRLHIVGGGYDQIQISSTNADNTNALSGIVTKNYEGHSTSIFQTYCQNDNNAVYWGSADSSHRGIQSHYFMVNADSNATTSHTTAMFIKNDGKVGIGTTDLGARLHVYEETSNTTTVSNQLVLDAMSSGTTGVGFGGGIYFRGERHDGGLQGMGKIQCLADVNAGSVLSSALTFQTAAAGTNEEQMRISSAGNVGIGTNNPGAPLDINRVGDGTVVRLGVQSVCDWDFSIGNTPTGANGSSGDLELIPQNANMGFAVLKAGQSAINMRTRDGVMTLGSGIKFNSDTADANMLDDYEEGEWTPTIASDAGPGGYTTQKGYYTKIGRQVHVTGQIRISSVGSFSGALINVSGLPATIANLTNYDPRGTLGLKSAASSADGTFVRGVVNTQYMRLEYLNGNTLADRNMNANIIDTDTIVYVDLTYFAA